MKLGKKPKPQTFIFSHKYKYERERERERRDQITLVKLTPQITLYRM